MTTNYRRERKIATGVTITVVVLAFTSTLHPTINTIVTTILIITAILGGLFAGLYLAYINQDNGLVWHTVERDGRIVYDRTYSPSSSSKEMTHVHHPV